jgi:DNA-binding response OmpR family regulator
MPILPIVYYGKPGLDADVFQAYMTSSGYPVQMVTSAEGGFPPNVLGISSITVIALEKSPQELLELAHEIRMQSNGCVKRVLILAEGQSSDADAPAVEFIHRPYRLSELVERVRAISRND